MKRLLFALYLITFSTGMMVAQEYSLNFMPDVWNSNYTNPGFFPRQNFVFSLPSVHASVNTLGLNRANVFRYDGTEDVYYLNYAELLDKLDSDVTLKSSAVVDALAIGFKAKKWFFSFNINTCIDGHTTAPQDFFRAVWEGTANYTDTPLNIGPSFNMMSYQKFGLGVNYTVLPKLSVGMRINRLIGLASFQTQRSQLTVTQSSEYYQTRLQLDYLVNYYAAGAMEPFDEQSSGIDNIDGQFDDFEFEAGTSLLSSGNNGWSFDLGGEYFLNDRWSFAASIINLGAIRWKNQTQQLSLREDYTYEGVEVSDINSDEPINFDEIRDTLENLLDFEAVGNLAYRQSLSPRTYLSARYSPASFITLGGLLYNEFGEYGTFTGLSLSSRFSLGRIFSLGGIYTLQSNAHNNFGVNTALKLGPMQIYGIADNLAPLLKPERLDGTNFRLGLNLTFGRKEMEEQLAANIEGTNPEVLADKPSRPKKRGKRDGLFSNNRKANEQKETDDLAKVEEQELSGEQKARKRKKAKREAEALANSKPRKSRIGENTEGKEALEDGSIASAEAVSVFRLQADFKDSLTAQPVEAAYVDIYRLDGKGNKVLVRTGRFAAGALDVVLNISEDTHEVQATAFGYEPHTYTFKPIPGRQPKKERLLIAESEVEDTPEEQAADAAAAPVASTAAEAAALPEEEEILAEVEMTVEPESKTAIEERTAETQNLPANDEADAENTYGNEETALVEEEAVELNGSGEELITEEVTAEEEVAEEPLVEEVAKEKEKVVEKPVVEEVEAPAVKKEERKKTTSRRTSNSQEGLAFYLTERTSLRSHATSSSDVLTRLPVGAELVLLEKTNERWWYMSYNGSEGWVKAHLLEEL